MGLWGTIKGWFGTAADLTGLTDAVDDATGGAVTKASDAMDTAEQVRDTVEDPMGAAGDMVDDATGGRISDARYAADTAASTARDPLGAAKDMADEATGGAIGSAEDVADLMDDD